MKIFKSDNTLLIDVEVNDSSYRFRELMGKDELNLEFSLPVYLEIPLGCHCSFQNQEYELLQPSNVTVKHRREYEYQVLFEASWGRMRRWVVTNSVDGSVEFPLTAKPIEHLNQLVWNLNQRDGEGTWSAGACIDAPEAVISYAFTKCDKALADIATTFNCEWEIVGHTISLHKLEYNKNNPLRLEYGSNKGFRSGVKRTNDGDSLPIGTLYVQGSEKNIDFSSYPSTSEHSKRLLLPRGVTVSFDGERFSDESGYDSSKAMTFVTDSKGYSVKRINGPHGTNTNEDSIDLSSIYPKRIGTVSAVKYIYDGDSYSYDELIAIAGLDWDKVQIDVIDDSIPASLDYWADDVRIEGETMTMVFQNGMLAGKEFDIQKFYKNADEFRLGNRFEIVRTEIDGICMPNATYRVYGRNEVTGKEASTYVIFNCSLPMSYITEAEKELLREALKFLYVHQDPKFSFTGDLDTMWAKRNWLNVGSRLVIGGYVNFVDQSLAPAPEPQDVGVLVRIISVKDYVNNPYCPTIELSTSTQAKSLSTALRKVENEHVVTDEKIEDSVQLSKRSFRNALETSRMLDEALETFKGEFSESVTPITIRTMSLLVGSENLQFKFIKSFTNLTDAPCPIHWDNNAKQLIYDESYLQHITLGVDDIAPKAGRTYDEYYIWRMRSGASAILADELVHTPFYVYAKVPVYNKATATEAQRVGDFIISKTAIGKDDVTGFYHLLCGTLSSETEGERSFARLYGFTEVLPGQITTDTIRTSDGLSFIELLGNQARLGGGASDPYIEWNVGGSKELKIHGIINVDGGGSESPLIVAKGEYSATEKYYWGDVVTYQGSNYLCIYELGVVKGIVPTNTQYWRLWTSKGDTGVAQFKSIVFKRTNSTPSKPSGGSYSSPVPDGWSDGVPQGEEQLWMSTNVFCSDGTSTGWTTPRAATDTADFDIEYSSVLNPSAPVGHPNTNPQWSNAASSSTIWMATSKKHNGVWSDWEVSKIKGEKGNDAEPIKVQYSANGTSWHDSYQSGDEYMRMYSQGSWGSAVKIKGEQGKIGPDGKKAPYHDFMFGISAYTSASGAPSDISSWSDTPPATTSAKPYLWCRDRYYTVNASNEWVLNSTTYYRLTGEKGVKGDNGNITKHQWALTLTTNPPAESQWKNSFSDVADHHGYYLWQRILESTDGGATWTVNPDSVGITLDPTITKEEAEAQEALTEVARQTTAQKLGYASWEAFSASVAASSVLIQGGQLNAALINTELLIAKMVKTAMAGLRVEVADNEISIFDNSESLVARMHGNYNSSISDFVSVTGSQTSVDVVKNSYSAKGTSEYKGSSYLSDLFCEYPHYGPAEESEYTGNSFQITNTGASRVTGRLQIRISTGFDKTSGINSYSLYGANVYAYVWLSKSSSYNSYFLGLGSVSAYQSNYHVDTSKYLDYNVTLSPGTYYVWIEYSGSITLLVQSPMWSYINYEVVFYAAATVSQTEAAKVSLISEKLEIFANGAGYRHTQNDYAVLLRTGASKTAAGYLQAEVQSGLAGLRIGQNYSGSYLEARMGSSYFGIVPKVIAKFLWNSSNNTYNLTRWMVRGSTSGTKPYTVQEDRGVVFNLPNDTSEIFGDGDIYIATCQVTANTQMIAAEVQRMTTTQIRIYAANASSSWERCHISLLVW